MGGGELHLESSRQPGHSKEKVWCRHNSKENDLSDLEVESAMMCNLEIEHGKSPQINFFSNYRCGGGGMICGKIFFQHYSIRLIEFMLFCLFYT